ncbi:MAG TPA: hypothetical protein VGD43_00610 [Micromonospora sp.]
MSRHVTPERLAQARVVSADSILHNLVDLRGYPHRHLAVTCPPEFGGGRISKLLAAVEYLGHFGWELVNVTEVSSTVYAFLRRR